MKYVPQSNQKKSNTNKSTSIIAARIFLIYSLIILFAVLSLIFFGLSKPEKAKEKAVTQQTVRLKQEKHSMIKNEELREIGAKAKHGLDALQKEIKSMVGKKVPFSKWGEWGFPDTLEGTSNKYWVAYIPEIDVSFVSIKKTDMVLYVGFGKNSAKHFLDEKKKARKKHIEKQFSGWDGSHLNLTLIIKAAMNDPSSYKHVETTYWDMDDHLIVNTTYRGKNAFGAIMKGFVKAKVSSAGDILEILEEQ